jgi:hypothetical protein
VRRAACTRPARARARALIARHARSLFVHPYTTVLCVRTPVPDGDYEITISYEKRGCDRDRPTDPGRAAAARTSPARTPNAPTPARASHRWCHFEMRLSSIVKSAKCLWDLSLHPEGKHITFEKCQDTLRCGRPPLTSPDQMAKELRKKAFTDSADLAALASLYRDGFAHALDTYRAYDRDGSLSFMDLNWGTAQLPTLVAALEYAEAHCRPKDARGRTDVLYLWFDRNLFTEAEKAQLRAVIPKGSTKFVVGA